MSLKGLVESILTNKNFQNFFWDLISHFLFHKKVTPENQVSQEAQQREELSQRVAKVEAHIAQTAANKPTTEQLITKLNEGEF